MCSHHSNNRWKFIYFDAIWTIWPVIFTCEPLQMRRCAFLWAFFPTLRSRMLNKLYFYICSARVIDETEKKQMIRCYLYTRRKTLTIIFFMQSVSLALKSCWSLFNLFDLINILEAKFLSKLRNGTRKKLNSWEILSQKAKTFKRVSWYRVELTAHYRFLHTRKR